MTTLERPTPAPPREYHFPSFSEHSLANGSRLIVAPVHKLPVVTILAVLNVGATVDPTGSEGLAQLTAEMLREGTQRHAGLELLEGFENLGSSLEIGADWDTTMVSVTLLSQHLSEGLELFAEVITTPSFPDHELNRLKAERLAERLQILSEPRALADESFTKALYSSNSRYSKPIGGTSASISAISRDGVVDFFNSYYAPDAATLIVVGDVEVEHAVSELDNVLGSWQGQQVRGNATAGLERRTSAALEIVEKKGAAQAELRLGHAGIPRNHPDYFNVVVMNALLGGLFSSRINLNLRERHGYTYGATSYFDWRRDPGPFVIATAVQTEASANAIREMLNEIDEMRHHEALPGELSLATSYLEGVFPIRFETTAAIASALATQTIFDLPKDFYDTYREKIAQVSTTDVLEAAQKYIHPEKLQCVVVGNPDEIKGSLEALDLGPVSVRTPMES